MRFSLVPDKPQTKICLVGKPFSMWKKKTVKFVISLKTFLQNYGSLLDKVPKRLILCTTLSTKLLNYLTSCYSQATYLGLLLIYQYYIRITEFRGNKVCLFLIELAPYNFQVCLVSFFVIKGISNLTLSITKLCVRVFLPFCLFKL